MNNETAKVSTERKANFTQKFVVAASTIMFSAAISSLGLMWNEHNFLAKELDVINGIRFRDTVINLLNRVEHVEKCVGGMPANAQMQITDLSLRVSELEKRYYDFLLNNRRNQGDKHDKTYFHYISSDDF